MTKKMKYYVGGAGEYLGGTDGGPLSSTEVPSAPDDARQKWDGSSWDEVVLTVAETTQAKTEALTATDSGMSRVTEDLIEILVAKGVIAETDLPADAQAKLSDRRAKRAGL